MLSNQKEDIRKCSAIDISEDADMMDQAIDNTLALNSSACDLTTELIILGSVTHVANVERVEIDVFNGTPPYSYTWDAIGYVRQAVINSGDATPWPNGTVELRIDYGEGAYWAVTITDSEGCTTSVSKTGSRASEILELTNFNIEADEASGGIWTNSSTGRLMLNTSYGTPPYQYELEGPVTWNPSAGNTEETITPNGAEVIWSELPYGWYGVTITDSGSEDPQYFDDEGQAIIDDDPLSPLPKQTVSKWFWVPYNREGRGKTAIQEPNLIVTNDSRTNELRLEFSVSDAENLVKLELFNLTGQDRRSIFEGSLERGQEKYITIDKNTLVSGIYILTLSNSKGVLNTKKIVVE